MESGKIIEVDSNDSDKEEPVDNGATTLDVNEVV